MIGNRWDVALRVVDMRNIMQISNTISKHAVKKGLIAALMLGAMLWRHAPAEAATSYSPQSGTVPVNIMFLVDNTSTMATCWSEARTETNGDGTITDLDACTPAITSTSSIWRRKTVVNALRSIVNSADGAHFGLAITDTLSTSNNPDGIGHKPGIRDGIMVPLGASKSDFLTTLDKLVIDATGAGTVYVNPSNAIPVAEAVDDIRDYLETGSFTTNPSFMGASPIEYWCQETHIIIITDGVTPTLNVLTNPFPDIDKTITSVIANYASSPSFNPTLLSAQGYYNRYLENVVSYIANTDMQSSLSGPQVVVTHVVALDYDQQLMRDTATNGNGTFAIVTSPAKLEGELWGILNSIMSGTYINVPPTISAQGDKLFLGFFEVKPDRPLFYGHLNAFDLQDDATTSNYGEIDTTFSQPAWEAGDILASRFVGQQDVMTKDNNGKGVRDIYTNINNDSDLDPFDGSKLSTLCPMMLDKTTDSNGDYLGVAEGHDVDGDGDVDDYDCMDLMDFVRGYYLAEFTSTGLPRGHWKLGDIRHSQVAVAESEPKIYTRNTSLREFLTQLASDNMMSDCPNTNVDDCALDAVFVTANDGMLHAFSKHTGDELWAYIPQNLLGEMSGAEEKAELLDMMNGETITMDATPRIEYIWIDGYCSYSTSGCTRGSYYSLKKDGKQEPQEWARVLLVGQGGGGRYYLALDVTNPQFPFLLWEDTNDTAPTTGMGSTTSTPVAGLIYDVNNTPGYDRWVAFYGSGEGDGASIDARLYIKSMGDVFNVSSSLDTYADTGIKVKVDLNGDGADDGTGFPSNPTAVDKDNDGDIDSVFLVNSVGVMYKFVINTANINSSTGCLFFDPENARKTFGGATSKVAVRTRAYWSATASFNSNGDLILYWGTGSPYDLFNMDVGYLFAVVDSSACSEGILYTECNGTGYYELSAGEKLTGSPAVYAGGVYFSTFKPSSDACSNGEARVYGLDYQKCSAILDTNGDGTVDTADKDYVDLGEGIPSGVVIANDSVYVATSEGLNGGDVSDSVHRLDVEEDPFSGTVAIQYRELF